MGRWAARIAELELAGRAFGKETHQTMQKKLLSIQKLSQSYPAGCLGLGSREVLTEISFELEPKQRVLVAGPNGSGKSTLLRLLAGVERPSAGEALLGGLQITSSAARRRIGYAPDGCPFPGELPARTMIQIVGELAGLGRREARRQATRMLARVGLEPHAKRQIRHYSKGMQRRFTLAAAFLGAPDLLLLDEPTDGLDAQGFCVLDELFDEAQERGAALLFASHVASLTCHEVHILFEGRLARSGSPEELVHVEGGLLTCYRELGTDGA